MPYVPTTAFLVINALTIGFVPVARTCYVIAARDMSKYKKGPLRDAGPLRYYSERVHTLCVVGRI